MASGSNLRFAEQIAVARDGIRRVPTLRGVRRLIDAPSICIPGIDAPSSMLLIAGEPVMARACVAAPFWVNAGSSRAFPALNPPKL